MKFAYILLHLTRSLQVCTDNRFIKSSGRKLKEHKIKEESFHMLIVD